MRAVYRHEHTEERSGDINMLIIEILCAAILIAVIVNIVLTVKKTTPFDAEKLKQELLFELSERQSASATSVKGEIIGEIRASRTELSTTVQGTIKNFSDSLTGAQGQIADRQDVRLKELIENISKNQEALKTDIADKMTRLQNSQQRTSPRFRKV